MRSGAESPDDRLLNLERHGEQVGRGAAPPPRVTRPIWWETSCAYATGNAAQNPGPAATTSTTRWGWGRDTQPFGSRDKDKTENEMCTHVRAHTAGLKPGCSGADGADGAAEKTTPEGKSQ